MEKLDMFGNLKDITDMYQKFRQNPMQMLNQRFNIPQNVNLNDPNAILQHLMNSGQVSQNQINQVMQMKNNPMIQQLMNR
jgi:hypothetical protein